MGKEKNNKVIIALDIDDAILPSDSNYFGRTNDSLQLLEINLKRLTMICNKYNASIFIISDWSGKIRISSKNMLYGKLSNSRQKPFYKNEIIQWNLLTKYLNGYVIGVSEFDRKTEIRRLLSEDHRVIIIDDMDLSELESKDCLFCKTIGYISGNIGYKIETFINGNPKYRKIKK